MILLLACAPAPSEAEPIPWCEGPSSWLWDPTEDLHVFPDDAFLVAADTPTGRRVSLSPEDHPFLDTGGIEGFLRIYDDVSTLDGWGLSSALWFRADAPLKELPTVEVWADGTSVPVDLRTTDGGETLLVQPRFPLPEASEIVALVYNDTSTCVSPAARTRALLTEGSGEPEGARYQAALDRLDVAPEALGAISVYTTQSGSWLSRQVAADIATRPFALTGQSCQDEGAWRRCDALLPTLDYRGDDHIVPADSVGEPLGTYDLPVRAWLPLGEGPFSAALCGHGLGGDKGQCDDLAEIAVPAGIAVLAVDAVEHGEHPERTDAPLSLLDDLMILAIEIDPPGLVAPRLRDNFRQSAWDKLQLTRAIQLGADLDGDGAADIDAEHLAYVGVSLGAIMGPEPMALTDALDAGVLLVGGARVSSIISDSPKFSVLVDLMRPADASDGEVDRFFPLLQTVIDAGDPGTYAPHLTGDRFDGAAPSVLSAMAWQDPIVPNSTNEALARALHVPGAGGELWPIPDVLFTDGGVTGNLPSGATGGVLQFEAVQDDDGAWVNASHDNLHDTQTGQDVLLPFLLDALAGRTPTIDAPARPPE